MSVSVGSGTDIFVRKTQPGVAVGVGYWIDIFKNGVKIESFRVETKKRVTEIIKSYKEKYHTDRAFLNESQTHVTYNTKEERGETAMQSLDQELLKKANVINISLQKLLTPLLPVKIREANALGESIINPQGINFIPETPGKDASMSEEKIGPMIASKFVEFVSKNQPQQGQEWIKADDLYNPLKKWLTAIKKKITDYERMNNVQLDMQKISDISEGVTFSGDPQKIKESLKLDVSPDVATKVKEISGMKAGIRKKESQESMVRVSLDKNVEEDFKDILAEGHEEKQKGSEEDKSLKEDFGGSEDTSEIIDVFKKNIPKEKEDIRSQILSFINFSRNIKQAVELGKAISEWSDKSGVSLETAQQVFAEISKNTDIYKEAFNTDITTQQDYIEAMASSGILGDSGIKGILNILVKGNFEGTITKTHIQPAVYRIFSSINIENFDNTIRSYISTLIDKSFGNWLKVNSDPDLNMAQAGISEIVKDNFIGSSAEAVLVSRTDLQIINEIDKLIKTFNNTNINFHSKDIIKSIKELLSDEIRKVFNKGAEVPTFVTSSSNAKLIKELFIKTIEYYQSQQGGSGEPAGGYTTEISSMQ